MSSALFSFVAFEKVSLSEANEMLLAWGHKMGALNRGKSGALCHALTHESRPVAVTTASNLIAAVVGNCDWMKRENTIELSRLCAVRGGLCRVALRLWREFVFPALGYEYAVSYQDADLHNGNSYRFDGWARVGRSRSGLDTRSGRAGRDKYVWQWPPRKKPNDQAHRAAPTAECQQCGAKVTLAIRGPFPDGSITGFCWGCNTRHVLRR